MAAVTFRDKKSDNSILKFSNACIGRGSSPSGNHSTVSLVRELS